MDISIRNAEKKDRLLLFNWFNEVDSLKFKIKTQKRINIENHNKWFDERLIDIKTYIWIVEDKNNNPIGQIRFQKLDEKFYDIDISRLFCDNLIIGYRKSKKGFILGKDKKTFEELHKFINKTYGKK